MGGHGCHRRPGEATWDAGRVRDSCAKTCARDARDRCARDAKPRETMEGNGGAARGAVGHRSVTGSHERSQEATGEAHREHGKPRERIQNSQSGVPTGGTVPCSMLFLKLHVVAIVSLQSLLSFVRCIIAPAHSNFPVRGPPWGDRPLIEVAS